MDWTSMAIGTSMWAFLAGFLILKSRSTRLRRTGSMVWLTNDIWRHIIKFCDERTLAMIACVSKHFYTLTNEHWRSCFLRDFRAPDPGPTFSTSPWMMLYGSARMHASRISCTMFFPGFIEPYDHYRAGMILVESKHTHLVMRSEANAEGSLYAAEVENVMQGLWVVDMLLASHPTIDGDLFLVLDARHFEVVFPNTTETPLGWESMMPRSLFGFVGRAVLGMFDNGHSKELLHTPWIGADGDNWIRERCTSHALLTRTRIYHKAIRIHAMVRRSTDGEAIRMRLICQLRV